MYISMTYDNFIQFSLNWIKNRSPALIRSMDFSWVDFQWWNYLFFIFSGKKWKKQWMTLPKNWSKYNDKWSLISLTLLNYFIEFHCVRGFLAKQAKRNIWFNVICLISSHLGIIELWYDDSMCSMFLYIHINVFMYSIAITKTK